MLDSSDLDMEGDIPLLKFSDLPRTKTYHMACVNIIHGLRCPSLQHCGA